MPVDDRRPQKPRSLGGANRFVVTLERVEVISLTEGRRKRSLGDAKRVRQRYDCGYPRLIVRPDPTNSDEGGAFVQELTASQVDIRAFILASVADYAAAEEILQRTNLTLWKKSESYEIGTNFVGWAISVARFEILRFYRDRRRDRLVLDPDVAEMLLDSAEHEASEGPFRREALRECLGKLPPDHRAMIWKRYDDGMTIQQIASDVDRSIDAIKSQLLRIRRTLEACIRKREGMSSRAV